MVPVMRCPECGAEMQHDEKTEGWECPGCGTMVFALMLPVPVEMLAWAQAIAESIQQDIERSARAERQRKRQRHPREAGPRPPRPGRERWS